METLLLMTIDVQTENAAFQDGNGRAESARLLRDMADKIEAGAEGDHHAYDINGNKVGMWSYLEEPEA